VILIRGRRPVTDFSLLCDSGRRLLPPPLTNDSCNNPKKPHDARNHTISNHLTLGGLEVEESRGIRSQQHAQTTINDTECYHDSSEPEMPVRPDSSATVFLKLDMVDEAKDRLEEQQDEDDDADDWVVCVADVVWYIVDHVNTDTKANNVNDIGKELEDAMDEPNSPECAKANHDGSHWEEDDECERGQNAMGNENLLAIVDEGLRRSTIASKLPKAIVIIVVIATWIATILVWISCRDYSDRCCYMVSWVQCFIVD
jgi:hypothetical protein